MTLPKVCALLLSVGAGIGFAESDRVRDVNANSWWVYAGDHPVHGPWGIYTEIQVRRSDVASVWQQFQAREAATYRLSKSVQASIGYVFTYTGRYGDFPVARSFNEHRSYQQVTYTHTLKKLQVEHRFRNEQRWFQNFTTGTDFYWRYQNRARYQGRIAVPVSRPNERGQQTYVFGGDEILLAYGPNHGPSAFDQNRAFAGVGYKVTARNRVEVGYVHQFLYQRNGLYEESNHTFRVQFSSSSKLWR